MFAGSEPRPTDSKRNSAAFAALFCLSALVLMLAMRDFAIDDALISVRYARNLASGVGYRFNATDPVTDGVTPLPWAWLVAPLAHTDALTVLARLRVLGMVGYATAAAAIGFHVGSAPLLLRVGALALAAVTVGPAAYAVSGMETWVATALIVAAVLMRERPLAASLVAGLTVAFRPEAIGFAIVFAAVLGFEQKKPLATLRHLSLALLPFIVTAIVRYAAFGTTVPLAAIAKPSSPAIGFNYAVAGVLSSGVLVASFAPRALLRAPRKTKALVLAIAAHFVCITLAGGDWMPLFRLWVIVLPVAPLLFVEIAAVSSTLWTSGRLALALVLAVTFGGRAAMMHRNLLPARLSAIAQATPLLRHERVATLDIGWVSAATDGYVFDMAGVTNPPIAALPGGHTSKHLSSSMLRDRSVTRVLLWATAAPLSLDQWEHAHYPRAAEQRLARELKQWRAIAWLAVGAQGGGYVLLDKKPGE